MALSLCSRLLARHNNQLAQGHNSQSLWCRCLSFGHGRPQHMQSVSRDDCLVREWQRLEKEAQEGIRSPPGAEDLDRLSLEHNVLQGKWLINGIPSHELNSVWAAIKREVASGGLGTYAKVHGGQRDKVICVYTANFLDKEDVSRVRAKLWDMGHRKKLSYKTDAYTLCGIYWGTRKDLSPTKYSSSSRDTLQDV